MVILGTSIGHRPINPATTLIIGFMQNYCTLVNQIQVHTHVDPPLVALRHKSYLQMWSQQPEPFCRATGGHRHNILCSHAYLPIAFSSLKQIATLRIISGIPLPFAAVSRFIISNSALSMAKLRPKLVKFQ